MGQELGRQFAMTVHGGAFAMPAGRGLSASEVTLLATDVVSVSASSGRGVRRYDGG